MRDLIANQPEKIEVPLKFNPCAGAKKKQETSMHGFFGEMNSSTTNLWPLTISLYIKDVYLKATCFGVCLLLLLFFRCISFKCYFGGIIRINLPESEN